jgi:hypothetical protein
MMCTFSVVPSPKVRPAGHGFSLEWLRGIPHGAQLNVLF